MAKEQLSDVLSEFARTMVTDFPIQAILDHPVVRIVEVLPISAAGVTLIAPGSDPRYVAASDDSALRFEVLQSEVGEGPCLAAYETGEAVAVPNLADDDRFPKFSPRALEAGLVPVFTSRCVKATAGSAPSTCTARRRARSTPRPWPQPRRWPTSLPPISPTPRPAQT